MTTQEQLEKIIRNLNYRLDSDTEDTVLPKLASAILSAMRIDEDLLGLRVYHHLRLTGFEQAKEEWTGKHYQNKTKNTTLNIARIIASHAQEIIKFEEE